MKKATPEMRMLAKRLVRYEMSGSKASKTATAFEACEKLRPLLATFMGSGGFRALLARALALAKAEATWLGAVQVKADGSLEGTEKLHEQIDAEEFVEGAMVLLAWVLGLLVDFIGGNLTLRLVGEVWPKLPLNISDFSKGEKSEKTK